MYMHNIYCTYMIRYNSLSTFCLLTSKSSRLETCISICGRQKPQRRNTGTAEPWKPLNPEPQTVEPWREGWEFSLCWKMVKHMFDFSWVHFAKGEGSREGWVGGRRGRSVLTQVRLCCKKLGIYIYIHWIWRAQQAIAILTLLAEE